MLFSGFSPAFAGVILMMNGIIIAIVLLVVLYEPVTRTCARMRRHASAMLAFLMTHLGPRHR